MDTATSYENLVQQIDYLQKKLEKRRQAEDKYYRVLESISEGFMLLDCDLAITEVNNAMLKVSGYRRDDFIGFKVDKFYDKASVSFYSASRDHLSFEAQFRAGSGRKIPMLFSRSTVKDDMNRPNGYMYFNTRYLYNALDKLIEDDKLEDQVFALIFMDMDNFKRVVDSCGHLNGSQALKEVAQTIKKCLAKPCFGVAYGGDEFVVVLPGFSKQQAAQKAEEIRSAMKQTIYLAQDRHNVSLGASFGIAAFPQDSATRTGLLALADKAMFHVKQTGKDSIGISQFS